MRKLAAAFLAACVVPLAVGAGPAGAADDDSTLNCNDFGDNIRCTATDPDGLKRLRISDNQTGELIKVIHLDCSTPTTKRGFNFPDSGSGDYRVQIVDCAGNVDVHQVSDVLNP